MPSDQSLRIAKIILATTARTVRLRLRQMQASCHGVGVSLLLNCRLPVALQSFPDRLPVRRRRFHHHFLDPVLNAPLRQRLQLLWSGRKSEPLKLKLPFARHIGYDYRQHLLVHVDPMSSSAPGRERRARHRYFTQGYVAAIVPGGSGDAQ